MLDKNRYSYDLCDEKCQSYNNRDFKTYAYCKTGKSYNAVADIGDKSFADFYDVQGFFSSMDDAHEHAFISGKNALDRLNVR